MFALVRPFLEICLLRRPPQALPPSDVLLGLALSAHVLCGVSLFLVYLPVTTATLAGLTGTLLMVGLTLILMYLQRHGERIRQTLTALAGCDALIGAIGFPFTLWWYNARDAGDDARLPALILLALLAWSIAVLGHILRHALSTVFLAGLLIAVLFYWVSTSVVNSLFPIAL